MKWEDEVRETEEHTVAIPYLLFQNKKYRLFRTKDGIWGVGVTHTDSLITASVFEEYMPCFFPAWDRNIDKVKENVVNLLSMKIGYTDGTAS